MTEAPRLPDILVCLIFTEPVPAASSSAATCTKSSFSTPNLRHRSVLQSVYDDVLFICATDSPNNQRMLINSCYARNRVSIPIISPAQGVVSQPPVLTTRDTYHGHNIIDIDASL